MKNIRKKLSLLLSLVITVAALNIMPLAFGDDLVAINSTNFPDPVFIRLVEQEFDTNHDGYLSASERSTTEMDISGMVDKATWIDDKQEAISTIKGVEFFSDTEVLHCGGIGLETLDISSLANLTELYCAGNYLESLDVLMNFNLVILQCSDNYISTLRMPAYSTTLRTLHCYANFITSIKTSTVPNLVDLRCDQNELTSLDLSQNTKLETIKCSYNHLTSLDLSATAVAHATNADISNQEVEADATIFYNKIKIDFVNKGLNSLNYAGSSLDDYSEDCGFEVDRFIAEDVSQIADGFTYNCFPMLENAENMTVKVNVNRDFHQVNFYSNSNLTECIGKVFVNNGQSATAPAVPQAPDCSSFNTWSEDISNVTDDLNVYPVFTENHNYTSVVLENDNDTVTVTCQRGDSSYQVSFISIVNSKVGDAKYDANIDVVNDGYINAKDFAYLLKAR